MLTKNARKGFVIVRLCKTNRGETMSDVLIAPSILSADFGNLSRDIRDIEKAGADVIHIDVMDGHFVPNLTIGPVVIKGVRSATRLPFDVHLMISDPIRYIQDFRAAGADWITVHYEACSELEKTLETVKESGAKAGISIKPKTPVDSDFTRLLPTVDLVLVMSVEPGFGGQSFMPEVVPKIRAIRESFEGHISVDGGINSETAFSVREAGADILVAGSAVFGKTDRSQAIRVLRGT